MGFVSKSTASATTAWLCVFFVVYDIDWHGGEMFQQQSNGIRMPLFCFQ
jgi:hypothetical protein